MAIYRLIILTLIFTTSTELSAQRKYVVYFKDKANTTYDLSNPLSMISQRALDRRNKSGISIDSSDIPVNPSYVTQVENTGAIVIRKSKWFNAVVIDCDTSTLQQVLALPFVENDQRIFKLKQPSREPDLSPTPNNYSSNAKMPINYGLAENQIKMLGADIMHDEGFNGDGIWIGIFDSGFRNTDTIDDFDHLRLTNRILGTYDIVEGDLNVYDEHSHGTSVLSCIAAYKPGEIVGTGYGASVILFRTEDVGSETQLEEFNWLVAAEMADSMGVDIVNTSLGYSTMDNSQLSHTYQEMDGKTTIISRAARLAARKGILCVTSAGNEGDDPWYYITAPADADSIISVGAVKSDSTIAVFSGRGPSFDGRIKPDVVAQGQSAAVVNANTGGVVFGSGTSFSGPILTGFAAGLWQAFPNLTNIELIEIIRMSANRFSNPDNDYGYGIPNYSEAKFLSGLQDLDYRISDFKVFPNPMNFSGFNLQLSDRIIGKSIELEIFGSLGNLIEKRKIQSVSKVEKIELGPNSLIPNIIYLRIHSEYGSGVLKLIKN